MQISKLLPYIGSLYRNAKGRDFKNRLHRPQYIVEIVKISKDIFKFLNHFFKALTVELVFFLEFC